MEAQARHNSKTVTVNHKNVRRSHKRAWILVFCVVIFSVLFVSYAVRTSTYLHARLEPKLEKLGAKIGGHFDFKNVYAMGLTGLVLDDVTFTPDGMSDEGALHFASVTVYPDLLGMFFGDLNASAIEARGLKTTLDFSSAPTSHRTWLTTRRDVLASSTDALAGGVDTLESPRALPELRCIDCHIEVTHSKASVKLEVPHQTVTFDNPAQPWQAVTFSGEPVGACASASYGPLTKLFANQLCVQISTTGMAFESDALHINDLSVEAVDLGKIRLNTMAMKNIEVTLRGEKKFVHVAEGALDFDLSDEVPHFAGHYAFDYSEFEVLHEQESKRFGFGIAIKSTGDKSARFFGGYDVDLKQLGVTIDSHGMNFGPLFKDITFGHDVQINALPVTGSVELRLDLKEKDYHLTMRGAVDGGAVTVPMLAKEPLSDIVADLDMKAHFNAPARLLRIDVTQGHLGKILFSGGFVHEPIEPLPEGSKHESAANGAEAELPVTNPVHVGASLSFSGEAADFIGSLPKNFAPALTGYKLDGPYSGDVSVTYETDSLDALSLVVDLKLNEVKTLAYDPRSNFDLINTNNFMIRVNTATVPVTIGPRAENWASFYDLPRETAYAFIASEDTKFFTHAGMDLRAIRASLIANLKAEKVVRGGSTISQQVVKNLFLNQDKTLSRKFQEAFLTWQMESKLTKLRIFELYLNLAHWGKDTYGIRGAAKYYFQKNVRDLTLRESLFLASILPNPIIFGKQYADNKLSSSRIQKMINVANNLYTGKRIDKATLDETTARLKEGKISDRPRPVIE